MNVNRIAAAILATQLLLGVAAIPALAAGKSATLTGQVSDAMCGAKHAMPAARPTVRVAASSMDPSTR